jgi:hypothetical protein
VPARVKIDFVVPGFSKCGTTTLCALLDLYPEKLWFNFTPNRIHWASYDGKLISFPA